MFGAVPSGKALQHDLFFEIFEHPDDHVGGAGNYNAHNYEEPDRPGSEQRKEDEIDRLLVREYGHEVGPWIKLPYEIDELNWKL